MKIPSRLDDRLRQNPGLHGAVQLTLQEFTPWVKDNKLPFFPEYTDHGIDHIELVFQSAEGLIRDEAWQAITPEDSGALVLAILVHDIAMHLSEDGFISLVTKPCATVPFGQGTHPSWPDLWKEFLSQASRFDARKLRSLFGDETPIRIPPLDPLQMTLRDRLLIGDFLRRHHPRLAHEIAVIGVPGPDNANRLRFARVPSELANLAGLVGRSHGLGIRDCVETLSRPNRRELHKVHAPFLMALVRIADYLQIHRERAPGQVLQVRGLTSPISRAEWRVHGAVEDINCLQDDPEAMFVTVKPRDMATHLKLQSLFRGIQLELDESWAVLGEVYGRVAALQGLGLTVRRIRSNLEDLRPQDLKYIPVAAKFGADPEILKLLVEPLYGENPHVGVRELLQNALDACRERRDFELKHGGNLPAATPEADPDVLIQLNEEEDGTGTLEIHDRGIGMTASTVRDYFLKAGASFRRSEAWATQHRADGTTTVLRSGRFGIGVLAAFLIGKRLEVTTRHLTAAEGEAIGFTCTVEDELVEMQLVQKPTFGTTIRVRISDKEVFQHLVNERSHGNWRLDGSQGPSWDWFALDWPVVKRVVTPKDGKRIDRTQHWHLPASSSVLQAPWHRLTMPGFTDVHWRFGDRFPDLACNGIMIAKEPGGGVSGLRDLFDFGGIKVECPSLSVFDPDGRLPLTLTRDDLAAALPFADKLAEDVAKDFVAFALCRGPRNNIATVEAAGEWGRREARYPGIYSYEDRCWYWFRHDGYSICDPWFFEQTSPASIFIGRIADIAAHADAKLANAQMPVVPFSRTTKSLQNLDSWIRALGGFDTLLPWLNVDGQRLLLTKEAFGRVVETKGRTIPKAMRKAMSVEEKRGKWVMVTISNCGKQGPLLDSISLRDPEGGRIAFGEWHLKPMEAVADLSRVARIWRDHVGKPTLPYNVDERRVAFAQAFEQFNPYVLGHEAPASSALEAKASTDDDNDDDD